MASACAVNAVIAIGALLLCCSLHIDAKEWNDVENCGKCKHKCSRPPHSTPTCKHKTCDFECKRGFRDCDAKSNGCKTDVTSDLNNCGRCDHVCPEPPQGGSGGAGGRGGGGGYVGEATCIKGVCGLDCENSTGLAIYDGILKNGCEKVIWYSNRNCDGCGHACLVPRTPSPLAISYLTVVLHLHLKELKRIM